MNYTEFSRAVFGKESQPPYDYQRRLAEEPWPNLLNAPTGTGKTRAIGGAWLYRRYQGDNDTPRRLIYCLPMRSLVEQTAGQFQHWLERAAPLFAATGQPLPQLHIQMGGDTASDWIETPEHPAILIGTQDMLLSGALNRRYAASRYSWPMHFALLNNDALWVHDEVQLMGSGAATSAQLAAFRARLGCTGPIHSLWMSATLDPDHLATVDFRTSHPNPTIVQLNQTDLDTPAVARLLNARKSLQAAPITLDSDNAKKKAADYTTALRPWLLEQHRPGSNTLVILNTVERAQTLYSVLLKAADSDAELLLIHSRYRPADRARINAQITSPAPAPGRIIIATQAIEAGLDISSATLITELAPWSSLVQRFGRCHRYGEYPDGADIHWIDLDDELAPPYTADQLSLARATLTPLRSAAPADLPSVHEPAPNTDVIRLRDFLDLFDTDPDLSGHDLDISRYIRDADDTDLLLFWRDLSNAEASQPAPASDELCRVAIGSAARLIKRLAKTPYTAQVWDPLATPAQWRPQRGPLRPGMTLMLDQRAGGYLPDLGFQPDSKTATPLLNSDDATALESEADQADDLSRFPSGIAVELGPHLAHAEDQANALCAALGDAQAKTCVPIAARGHDTGKAHPAFLNMLLANDPDADQKRDRLWAKGTGQGRPHYFVTDADGTQTERRYFRHELASMLAWLAHHPDHPQRDLIAYLILAHHGKLRMRLRSLPNETEPPDQRLFARGVWDGDQLPAIDIAGREQLPETTLKLDLMQLGEGPQGPSWTARTAALLEQYGPFRLAWLETLVRLADWRASRAEQETSQ